MEEVLNQEEKMGCTGSVVQCLVELYHVKSGHNDISMDSKTCLSFIKTGLATHPADCLIY